MTNGARSTVVSLACAAFLVGCTFDYGAQFGRGGADGSAAGTGGAGASASGAGGDIAFDGGSGAAGGGGSGGSASSAGGGSDVDCLAYTDQGDWNDAKTKCEDVGAQLALMPDEATKQKLIAAVATVEFGDPWIGYCFEQGVLQAVDGSQVVWENWGPNEPMAMAGCVLMERTGPDKGTWRVERGGMHPRICCTGQ